MPVLHLQQSTVLKILLYGAACLLSLHTDHFHVLPSLLYRQPLLLKSLDMTEHIVQVVLNLRNFLLLYLVLICEVLNLTVRALLFFNEVLLDELEAPLPVLTALLKLLLLDHKRIHLILHLLELLLQRLNLEIGLMNSASFLLNLHLQLLPHLILLLVHMRQLVFFTDKGINFHLQLIGDLVSILHNLLKRFLPRLDLSLHAQDRPWLYLIWLQ